MIYRDLTLYSYRPLPDALQALNVGWLGDAFDFETYDWSAEVLDATWQQCSISVNPMRGLYECRLCTFESNSCERSGVKRLLGSAEIWVFRPSGEPYAAPNMLFHYMSVHSYKPPDEFVEALMKGPRPPDPTYLERLRWLGLDWRETPVQTEDVQSFRFVKTPGGDVEKVYEPRKPRPPER